MPPGTKFASTIVMFVAPPEQRAVGPETPLVMFGIWLTVTVTSKKGPAQPPVMLVGIARYTTACVEEVIMPNISEIVLEAIAVPGLFGEDSPVTSGLSDSAYQVKFERTLFVIADCNEYPTIEPEQDSNVILLAAVGVGITVMVVLAVLEQPLASVVVTV